MLLLTKSNKIVVHEPTLEAYYKKLCAALGGLAQKHHQEMLRMTDLAAGDLAEEFTPAVQHKVGIFHAAMGRLVEAITYILDHEEGVVAGTNVIAERLVSGTIKTQQSEAYLNAIVDAVGWTCEKANCGGSPSDVTTSAKIITDLVGAIALPVSSGNAALSLRGATISDLRSVAEAADQARTLFIRTAQIVAHDFFPDSAGPGVVH